MTYLTNDWYVEAAADARRRNSKSTVFLEILTSRLHEHMPYSAAWALAESKVDQHIKVVGLTESPDLIREFMRTVGLRKEGDQSPVTPPEVRFFNAQYPAHLARLEEEKARQVERERMAVESRAAAARAAEHKRLMRDMREWGPKNGFFVGTRGRIPRKVINAYREAMGL